MQVKNKELEEFKQIVLEFRYKFEAYEKTLFHRGSQQERRENYEKYMRGLNAPQEVIEYSLNEFIPLDRAHLEVQRQNQFPERFNEK